MTKQFTIAIATAALLMAVASSYADTPSTPANTPYDGKSAALGAVCQTVLSTVESSATQVMINGIKGYQMKKVQDLPRYFYYIVDPKFKNAAVPHVIITFTYVDQGPDSIDLVYDSNDQSVSGPNGPGSWKPLGTITINGTKSWRKVQFEVSDALFNQRLNGNDIRVQYNQDIDAIVGDCYVKAAK